MTVNGGLMPIICYEHFDCEKFDTEIVVRTYFLMNFTIMKKLKYFRNKYVLTFSIFLVYILFLDDVDIITIFHQKAKVSQLKEEMEVMEIKLAETKATLDELSELGALEKFAREKKMFKKEDEDIFVIAYEDELK